MSKVDPCSISWLHWVECHPGLAGYIQAAGAILALIIAVGIPVYQAFVSRRARYDKTCSVAVSLIPAVFLLENEVVRVGAALTRAKSEGPPVMWQQWVDALELNVPLRLSDAVTESHELEASIIGPFRSSAVFAASFNDYREQFFASPVAAHGENWERIIPMMEQQLALVRGSVDSARAMIGKARIRD